MAAAVTTGANPFLSSAYEVGLEIVDRQLGTSIEYRWCRCREWFDECRCRRYCRSRVVRGTRSPEQHVSADCNDDPDDDCDGECHLHCCTGVSVHLVRIDSVWWPTVDVKHRKPLLPEALSLVLLVRCISSSRRGSRLAVRNWGRDPW